MTHSILHRTEKNGLRRVARNDGEAVMIEEAIRIRHCERSEAIHSI